MEIKCYRGDKRDEASQFAKIGKCCCNCHMILGKSCGCCFAPSASLVFNVTPEGPGYVEKEYFGLVNECFTMADKYNVEFPTSDPDEQAVFLAAIQFMDMLYFEMNYWGAGGI